MCSGFPKKSCSNKKIERDDNSKKGHHALAGHQFKPSDCGDKHHEAHCGRDEESAFNLIHGEPPPLLKQRMKRCAPDSYVVCTKRYFWKIKFGAADVFSTRLVDRSVKNRAMHAGCFQTELIAQAFAICGEEQFASYRSRSAQSCCAATFLPRGSCQSG